MVWAYVGQFVDFEPYFESASKQNLNTAQLCITPLINAKRGEILSILCLMLVSLVILVAAPEPFLCINNVAVCP
jgi:hypothetical protein